MKLFPITSGPILELGSGMYSTCYLHWACFPAKRTLVTYEGQERWMDFARQFVADFHTVEYVADWEALDLSRSWSIALVDHDVENVCRADAVKKLLHAEYVVCHDTEREGKYGFDKVFPNFKYQYKYRAAGRPNTTVLSNVHDLTHFSIG